MGIRDQTITPIASLIAPKYEHVATVATTKNLGFTRDLSAIDRTYMAYMRTGLALVGLGLFIVKLFSSGNAQAFLKATGASMILSGFILFLYAYGRYRVLMKHIREGTYIRDSVITTLASSMLICCGIFALVLIVKT